MRSAPLAEAKVWLDQCPVDLSAAERALVQASLALHERRAAARQARRQRELGAERRRAEEHSRDAHRLRRWASLLAGALRVVGILALAALLFGRQATRERKVAQQQARLSASRELAAALLNNTFYVLRLSFSESPPLSRGQRCACCPG